jgi:RNA recognition motif-containing protein
MDDESDYPSFVKVAEKESSVEDYMELPREKDGTVLLSTIQAQFTHAIGLKYKSSSGAWRGIRAEDNILEPPHGGWGETVYIVTQGDGSRKKSEESSSRPKKKNKYLDDLIVFGIPVSVKNEDLKEYFEETCGEMEYAEIKHDRFTKKSRGFGFVRFKTEEGAREALSGNHEIEGRKLVVKFSEKKTTPMQLFVGRVPRTSTTNEVKEYFSDFGDLDDCFVPSGRGFAFVTFSSDEDGKGCLRASHTFKVLKSH